MVHVSIHTLGPQASLQLKSHDESSIDFVRGAAFAISGLEEIALNEESRVSSFRGEEGARINVHYTIRTLGTALDHPIQGKTQLFRRNCSDEELIEILRDPRKHTGKGYKRRLLNEGKSQPANRR